MDKFLLQRLWRRPWLSFCSLILSGILCFTMGLLSGYQKNLEQELAEVKTEYDILCVATDRRGARSTSLLMDEEILGFIYDEGPEGLAQHMRDMRITKEFSYVCYQEGLLNMTDLLLIGVNDARCDPRLDPALGGEVSVEADDFYTSDTYQCIVSEDMMAQLSSDHIVLDIDDPIISENIRQYVSLGSGTVELAVVGTYAGTGNRIFISFEAARRISREISKEESVDSLCFFAKDNEGLDDIYATAKRYFSKVNPNSTDTLAHKPALTIHDEQYRATITALEQNIARTGYLLPVVLVLGLGVGFLISFLYTRNERKTYALMRTMGMTCGKLFGSILREQLVLVAIAVLAALAMTREILPAAVYFACYAVGCAACIMRAIRVPPTAILREQE